MAEKMFTAEEVAKAVVEGNRVLVDAVEQLANRVALAEFQRDQLAKTLKLIQQVDQAKEDAGRSTLRFQ